MGGEARCRLRGTDEPLISGAGRDGGLRTLDTIFAVYAEFKRKPWLRPRAYSRLNPPGPRSRANENNDVSSNSIGRRANMVLAR